MTDDDAVETFYTDERWQNWLDRLEEEDLDPENEDSARLLLNLQDDAAIAVVKVLAGSTTSASTRTAPSRRSGPSATSCSPTWSSTTRTRSC